MPGKNKSGPFGAGRMTGRGIGNCGESDAPENKVKQPFWGRSFRFGYRRGGGGMRPGIKYGMGHGMRPGLQYGMRHGVGPCIRFCMDCQAGNGTVHAEHHQEYDVNDKEDKNIDNNRRK